MKIGLTIPQAPTLEATLQSFEDAERAGFHSAWFSQPPTGSDALTVLALAAPRTERILLGSAVVPTFPRHPLVTARTAATLAAAAPGRAILGVGSGHRVWVEDVYGIPFERPVQQAIEWIGAVRGAVDADRAGPPVPVVLAATGPRMLEAGGEVADGVLTWMGDEVFLEEVVMPAVSRGAGRAGREAPPVLAGVLVCLTGDPVAARAALGGRLSPLGAYESYRGPLGHRRSTPREPIDVAIVGDAEEVRRGLDRIGATGVEEVIAVALPDPANPEGSLAQVHDLLGRMSGSGR